jgi:diadenosine tetraphosphate (Ap4A) HIT family hydrolase
MVGEERVEIDLAAYVERSLHGPCFVCRIAGEDPPGQHVVYRDDRHLAFLPNFHVLLGYVIVAPVEHREEVVADFAIDDYLDLQRLIHRVGRALAAVVPTERLYLLSLGSRQGNAHVHWHVAALPPGTPYGDQQFRALMVETKGVLAMTDDDQRALADRIRAALAATG